MKEKWTDIDGYEGLYRVSTFGRVRSKSRLSGGKRQYLVRGRFLKTPPGDHGYPVMNLCKDGVVQQKLVHQLVAEAFIPNPHNKPEVNHKDGNKSNNKVRNLEWSTEKENSDHAHQTGLMFVPGTRRYRNARLTERKVRLIRNRCAAGISQQKTADLFGIHQSQVSVINSRKQWGHLC